MLNPQDIHAGAWVKTRGGWPAKIVQVGWRGDLPKDGKEVAWKSSKTNWTGSWWSGDDRFRRKIEFTVTSFVAVHRYGTIMACHPTIHTGIGHACHAVTIGALPPTEDQEILHPADIVGLWEDEAPAEDHVRLW